MLRLASFSARRQAVRHDLIGCDGSILLVSGLPQSSRASSHAGRPALPKGHAKARIVPVRFNVDDLKVSEAAAKSKKQTLSEWIRSRLNAEIAR